MSDDLRWRLHVRFGDRDHLVQLRRQLEKTRPRPSDDDDDWLTESGDILFAYAATREELDPLRRTVETLDDDARTTATVISRWDRDLEQWRQVDPPLEGEARALDEELARAAQKVETRTLPCTVGRFEREIFANLLREYARVRELACDIAVVRRRLLREQLTVTITGPAAKLDEFEQYMRDQARRTRHIDFGSVPMG